MDDESTRILGDTPSMIASKESLSSHAALNMNVTYLGGVWLNLLLWRSLVTLEWSTD